MIVDLVSAARQANWENARDLLYRHWGSECPKLYAPNPDHPWEIAQDDKDINKALFVPLAGAFCADSSVTDSSLRPLIENSGLPTEGRRPGQICGHVFKSGELTYSCKDCATDATCVMCHECFHLSEHKTHKYKMHTSSGAGYCDCGDEDAWTSGYACKIHEKNKEDNIQFSLPQSMETRLRGLTCLILQYSAKLICWEKTDVLPLKLSIPPPIEKPEVTSVAPYVTVLYNDETHTYETVIRALEMFINCTKDQAMLIATIVDREGRSAVKVGAKQDCERVKSDIQRRTLRDMNRRTEKAGPLDVKVLDGALVAHQNHAIALLAWLNSQIDAFPVLGSIVGDILLNTKIEKEDDELGSQDTILVRLLRFDKKMWKSARANTHQMLMKTVLMNFEQKVVFSKTFLAHYDDIYKEFIDDDHDIDISVVSLTVQFLTVPSIARRLIAEDDAMRTIFTALMKHTDDFAKDPKDEMSRFDFAKHSFPVTVRRGMHMMRDLGYILTCVPSVTDWNDQLRERFLDGCQSLIKFLHRMQGMDEVKRQSVEHQVWELEWETAFNIQLRIQDILGYVIAWAGADRTIHRKLLLQCLDALNLHPPSSLEESTGATHTVVDVNGESTVVIPFDVLRGAVSIHQPLWRLTAGLFTAKEELLRFMLSTDTSDLSYEEVSIRQQMRRMASTLYEMPLRALVLCAQASAQLWRRNGFSLVNQIHNYYSPLCRAEMFDRDLLMMQVGAAIRPPADFLLHIICRFRLVQWADQSGDGGPKHSTPFGKMEPEETGKIIVVLAEEMLHLLIMILGERYHPGVGKCTFAEQVQREVVHVLCTGPQPFSHIQKRMSHDPMVERISLHDILSSVAKFNKPTSTSAGQFHLKDSLLPEYNPFFYHYSKSDLSQAEQYQQKVRSKLDRKLQACPPPTPCDFEPFFAPAKNILKTPCLIKILKLVLDRTGKRSRFSSDRLLHRALYLIGMALHEQTRDPRDFLFTEVAEKEELFRSLESLSGSSEVATHADLLWWTIQKYKEVQLLSMTGQTVERRKESTENQEGVNDARAKRAARAAKMREQAMLKMSKMQKSFLKVMETENPVTEQTDCGEVASELRGDDDEDFVCKQQDHGFPVCIGPQRSIVEVVLPRKVTCILCQEEETLSPSNGKAFVCAAYVQKSLLFSQRGDPESETKLRDLAPANLSAGIDASTCSHTMHYECFHSFSSARGEEVEDFDTWVNRVKTLLDTPPVRQTPTQKPKSHSRKRSHSERSLLELAKQGDDLSTMPLDNSLSTSVPSASTMSLLLGQKPPSRIASQTVSRTSCTAMDVDVEEDSQRAVDLFREMTEIMREQDLETRAEVEPTSPPHEIASSSDLTANRRERRSDGVGSRFGFLGGIIKGLPAAGVAVLLKLLRKIVGPSYERYEEMVKLFSSMLLHKGRVRGTDDTKSREVHDDVHSPPAALAVWKSAAHVARTTAAVLANERKPLFCAMNTRQRDCLLAMARLSAVLSFCIQLLPDFTANMLRVLLAPPPPVSSATSGPVPVSPRSPEYHNVASPVHSFTNASPLSSSADSPAKLLSSTFAQLFSSKKEVNINLLHVDMLSLAISLMMSIGWTWHDGVQSLKPIRQLREMLPDGSQDELHVLRLCLTGLYLQVFVTFEDSEMACEQDNVKVDESLEKRLKLLWSIARPTDFGLIDVPRLQATLTEATLSFLRPLALFYHALTLINPPEALKDPSVDEFEPLCRYMGLPCHLVELLDGFAVEQLFDMWSAATPPAPHSIVRQPIRATQLVDLPYDFSEVIHLASAFRCPSIPLDENAANVPTMCLVCGQILCSQSYCCQKQVGKESTGACRYHMIHCSGPMGIFLRIRDCAIVLMTTRNRGCFRPAPYVDEFGEADQGFRRGNPLHLNEELYHKLRQLWLQQGISEEVVNQYEIDHRNMQYDWGHF
ncbi:ATP-dependent Clp protease adaptor protein ClpS [Necator americanus]|uniref:E3 ubiquitin-protein ligase n=1 Tax=Necator americanus TaxID=51031 RepID=W2TV26_NECAM|nr:ATP-dependent Clp protease adaptor protein ClpS [Necator americanus]ETN84892.1 ATP-dependent Clp protease adaptor protein ClpS [Necator americanus]